MSHRLETVSRPALTEFTRRLVNGGEVSAVVAGVCENERLVASAAGQMIPGDRDAGRVELATRFDIASLTKPFAASVALELDRRGVLPLDTPLGECVDGLPSLVRRFPLQALLRHQAGLIPWFPFYAEPEAPEVDRFADRRLWGQASAAHAGPADEGWAPAAYSDLGPILWSVLVRRSGVDMEQILVDLDLGAVYTPEPQSTASTALSNRREVELAAALGVEVEEENAARRGVPQDGNARCIPRSGHAGLFATLADLVALGREWLRPRRLDRGRVETALHAEGRYALGWWRADPERDSLPSTAFGHNGFTGCSLWVEPERQRIMVLLAHRTTLSDTLERARREFHRLALGMTP